MSRYNSAPLGGYAQHKAFDEAQLQARTNLQPVCTPHRTILETTTILDLLELTSGQLPGHSYLYQA